MKKIVSVAFFVSLAAGGLAALDLPDEPRPAPVPARTTPVPKAEVVDELGVVFDLQDGSHIVGRITPRNFPVVIRSESIGEVKIPLERIRGIQFAASNQTVVVTLQNGDKLQGVFTLDSLKLVTSFGKYAVPVAQLKQLEVRSGRSGDRNLLGADDWDVLSFAENSSWGGDRGKPATITANEMTLRGRPVRSRQSFSLPLSVSYEARLDKSRANGGCVYLLLLPADEDEVMEADRFVSLVLLVDGKGNWQVMVNNRLRKHEEKVVLNQPAPRPDSGSLCELRADFTNDGINVTVNGETYMTALTVPYKKFRIALVGWQPDVVWQLRKVSVQ